MASADKRAKLLSDLMAQKGAAQGNARLPAETDRASVIQIARHRLAEDRAPEPAPTPAPGVLYSKGAATASSFRPSYWSFEHEEPADAAAAAVAAAPPAHAERATRMPINFVVAFGCLALVVSTTLFVLSYWHRAEVPAAPQQIAAASAPAALIAPLPQEPPGEPQASPRPPGEPQASPRPPGEPKVSPRPLAAPRAQEPPVAAVPAPAVSAPAAPPAPAPVPMPAASEAPPAPALAAPSAPAPAIAAPAAPAIAAAPAPTADSEADALLARGDDLLMRGDVAAARLFYQRAAEQGSATAATAVGQTFDPGVLELLRVRGARGDPQLAAEWYRKAIAAGDRQAEIRLKRLVARSPG